MIRFIENVGDYFSQHFFNEDFPKKVFDKSGYVTQKRDDDNVPVENHITYINGKIAPLREKYFRFKNDFLNIHRKKDRIKLTHDFHTELLKALDYTNGTSEYTNPVFLNDTEIIPVRLQYPRGDKPYLFIMEMQAMIKEGDEDPEGIFDQVYLKDDWEKVFPQEAWKDIRIKPDVINEELTELFILPEDERPVYVIMLAAPKIFLIHYEKWKYDSFLLFDLEELFTESQVAANKDYLALFYALLSKPQFISQTDSILHVLEEDAHKAMYGVTQALKNSVIFAVESLANEAIYYKMSKAKTPEEKQQIEQLMTSETFARELKDDCLTFVYRLLFLFYAESREDLEILPVKDPVYQRGYSLEMLRDLEMVPLTSDSSRNSYFFSQSLWKLFTFLHKGQSNENGFTMKPLDSPLFDNESLIHLKEVQFRNYILQEIILRLSLSERTRNKGRGRISYSNLGINQLGSVYESLLAYTGFFAAEPLIEVKAADDPDGREGTFLVPKRRRDDFEENEILKDPEHPERDMEIEKGRFVYRLNGRDRKKTASYYTPEVLTQTTVKYTLKGILDRLKERQKNGEDCADEILNLKILEPAMGAAAFQNEVINQLAVAYLELKETEVVRKGGKRVIPGQYNDEIQKVKAFIASHNVYGVDINPTAIELGKLSLWLNCMHRDMETPFFAHRLGVGNAVVGAWLKVYDAKDFIAEYPKEGTPKQRKTPVPKEWWNKAPQRVIWKNGKLTRKDDQIYHFLLPDDNMVPSAGIKMLKEELTDAEIKAFNAWKKAFKSPIRADEHNRLKRICNVIDVLLEEHYLQTVKINSETASHYNLYGQTQRAIDFKNYREKERLAKLRNERSAPYYKLKTIMDYWCSLWFWDVRKVKDLPTREQWYNEVESILGLDFEKLETVDSKEERVAGFEPLPEQQKLFNEPRQMSIGSKAKVADPKERIKQLIAEYAGDVSSLYNHGRIQYIQKLSENYRFFHNELEFIEVFKEGAGFNVIVGNPPWVKVTFEEGEIMSESYPEIIIRKEKAPVIAQRTKSFINVEIHKSLYLNEYIAMESASAFMNAYQNYPLLKGQQTDLFRCIITQTYDYCSKDGFIGLLHPVSIFDDPKGYEFRKVSYTRLKYHFRFKNELRLFDIHHENFYSLNVYDGISNSQDFIMIHNLFHPNTIDASLLHNGYGVPGGIKKIDNRGKLVWNTDAHKSRVITITEKELKLLSRTFEDSEDWEGTKLVSIHAKEILTVIEKLSKFSSKIAHYENIITECWHETNDVNINIKRQTTFPHFDAYELIYNGPHFFVGNPFYKTPREVCEKNHDYDNIILSYIKEDFHPRTNYLPITSIPSFIEAIKGFDDKSNWIDLYKVAMSKMISLTGERSLQAAVIPPKVSHVNGVISITFKDESKIIEYAGLASSLILDFYVKSIGASNLTDGKLRFFPLGVFQKFYERIAVRTLLLNCLNRDYANLWQNNFQIKFKEDQWSKKDDRLKPFNELVEKWSWEIPLRNYFERRQALIELDVISAMALGLNLNELILLYEVQFPVLQNYEENTYYDQNGEIVYTNNSQGLKGIGVDSKVWNSIKDFKKGQVYEHIIERIELYKGKKMTYYAPFDKCDRVEDYKIAWKHFEKVFSENK
jgi:hypothetical protein